MPTTTKSGKSQLLPVMLYLHGGEFTHGSGNDFPGHQLAAWGQVVVFTVNYRQGQQMRSWMGKEFCV